MKQLSKSVSRRIAEDRGPAGFWASLASLAPFSATLGLIFLAYEEIVHNRALEKSGGEAVIGIILIFAYLFWLVTRWTYDSAHAALTPQRVQAMWLRRFQTEKGQRFRPSREIDRLSRFGISSLTLQDRDVQLSFEQRRNRLAPFFWVFFLPIAAILAVVGWQSFHATVSQFSHVQTSPDLRTAVGQIIGNFIAELVVLALLFALIVGAILLSVLLIMGLAAISGPIGASLSKKRDDFQQIPRLLERIRAGKRAKGAAVLRIGDDHWREAVTSSLSVADAAIIDLSNMTGNIAWEIGQAAEACTPAGLVFIRRENLPGMTNDALEALHATLGHPLPQNEIVTYPAEPGSKARTFARKLRKAIYAAVDHRAAV